MIERLLQSLSFRIRREEAEWISGNPLMRRMSFKGLDDVLSASARAPVMSIAYISLMFAILLLLASDTVYYGVSQWPWPDIVRFPTWSTERRGDLISLFLAIWTVQTTVSALVYPIVLAFVTLLLQRSASTSVVRSYLHFSGAAFAGLSALALVGAMLAQYAFLVWRDSWISNRQLAWWCVIASLWLMWNLILTIRFLLRTLAFLSPRRRYRETVRYALCVVWPLQVRLALTRVFAAHADSFGLLPEMGSESDTGSRGPILRLDSYGQDRVTAESVSVSFDEPKELDDIWYAPLRIAVSRWSQRVLDTPFATHPSGNAPDQARSTLCLPIAPGRAYEGEVVLARLVGPARLDLLDRLLVKLAYRFKSAASDDDEEDDVAAYLKDLIQEALLGLRTGHEETFREALLAANDLHAFLIRGSETSPPGRSADSLALLPSSSAFSLEFHQKWAGIYRPLAERVVTALDESTEYFESACYIPFRVVIVRGPIQIPAIRERVVGIAAHLLWQLAKWWKRKVELQGTLDHGMCASVTLRPPFLDTHQRALRLWIGAWETLQGSFFDTSATAFDSRWVAAQQWYGTYVAHIDLTARALIASVHRGDRLGAEWLGDVLQKWLSQLDFRFQSRGYRLRRHHLLTVESLQLSWEQVRAEFAQEEEPNESSLQEEVMFVALRNYWGDVRCLVAFLLATWTRDCECAKSLPADILRGLLDNRSWLAGAEVQDDSALARGPAWLFKNIVRQQFGGRLNENAYLNRLDTLVENLVDVTEAEWVSGRVHVRVGANDVQSILDGHLVILLVLSQQQWDLVKGLEADVRGWLSDDARVRELQSFLDRLLARLSSETFSAFEAVYECLTDNKGPHISFVDARQNLKLALEGAHTFVGRLRSDQLRNAPISQERLDEYASYASSTAFSKETGAFPLQLFATVEDTVAEVETRRLTIKGMEKGGFTKPEMTQRASNEREWIAEAMQSHVGAMVLNLALREVEFAQESATTAQSYWKKLKDYARALEERELTPILLLDNATRPRWVWDWTRFRHGQSDSYDRPEDMTFSVSEGASGSEYLGHLNHVAVYSAQISFGESLVIPRELFQSVAFRRYAAGRFVSPAIIQVPGDFAKVDLVLEWGLRLRCGPREGLRLRYSEP